jgi:hypothetical protein
MSPTTPTAGRAEGERERRDGQVDARGRERDVLEARVLGAQPVENLVPE